MKLQVEEEAVEVASTLIVEGDLNIYMMSKFLKQLNIKKDENLTFRPFFVIIYIENKTDKV